MYVKITAANPAQCSINKMTAEIAMKIYLILLLFQANDLNFSENSGNSATSKYENRAITANRKKMLSVSFVHKLLLEVTNANEHINSALAGVGNPMNDSV